MKHIASILALAILTTASPTASFAKESDPLECKAQNQVAGHIHTFFIPSFDTLNANDIYLGGFNDTNRQLFEITHRQTIFLFHYKNPNTSSLGIDEEFVVLDTRVMNALHINSSGYGAIYDCEVYQY